MKLVSLRCAKVKVSYVALVRGEYILHKPHNLVPDGHRRFGDKSAARSSLKEGQGNQFISFSSLLSSIPLVPGVTTL